MLMLTRRAFGLGCLSGLLAGEAALAQAENRFVAFFTGRVTGGGTVRNYQSGKTRTLKATLNGRSQGGAFLLQQDAVFSDGVRENRQWRFEREGARLIGYRQDLIGEAELSVGADSARLSYKARIAVDGETHDLNFVENIRFVGANRVTNATRISFWLVPVGEIQLALQKQA